jgi:hypothetical protein
LVRANYSVRPAREECASKRVIKYANGTDYYIANSHTYAEFHCFRILAVISTNSPWKKEHLNYCVLWDQLFPAFGNKM